MPVGCIMWDTAFRVSLWNPMAEQVFGYPAAEALGRHADDLIVPEEARPAVHAAWERLLTGAQTAHSVNGNRTREGRSIVCEWFNTPLRDARGAATGVLSMVTDITERVSAEQERQRLQEQLLQSQKMEAIGLLAGGVAHDFNNILSAILGYASIIQMKMRPEDPLRAHVEQVLAASKRAAGLTQSLLAFSRKQVIHPRPLEVNESVRRIESLLRRLIGEDIDFVTRYHRTELMVLADPTQFEQVVINLATNARDAMLHGGTMTLSLDAAEIDGVFIREHGFGQAGRYARIAVSDTGMGIDEETRAHIFEPFFTTKEVGKGTGLGLSTVYGIVKQNNGYIVCVSTPGAGTTFQVYLPLTAERGAAPAEDGPQMVRQGTETVLIAEDDAATRALFQSVFEEQGYTVITAANGEEAIERFRERAGAVQLLVLDVIMPKKNGREVLEQARRIRPEIKALFTSGYTADIIHARGVLDPSIELLPKPVSPADLLQKARAVLDGQ
jgi:PAS domain S-box-containing protein